jgi:hypothetical protein
MIKGNQCRLVWEFKSRVLPIFISRRRQLIDLYKEAVRMMMMLLNLKETLNGVWRGTKSLLKNNQEWCKYKKIKKR